MDSLDTIASAFAQRGHLVRLSYLGLQLFIAVATDEAVTPGDAVAVAVKRSRTAFVDTLVGEPTIFSQKLGPLLKAEAFPDTEEQRGEFGLIPPETEAEFDPRWYEGQAFGKRESTVCEGCGELLMKHEAGRGSECDSCRTEAKLLRKAA